MKDVVDLLVKEKKIHNNPKKGMASYCLTEEQDNSTAQLPDDPKIRKIWTH